MRRPATAPPRSRPGLRRPVAALLASVALVALSACSGADDAATSESVSDVAASGGGFRDDLDVGEESAGDAGGAGDAVDDRPAPPTAVPAAAGRERIRTAWITLEFEDPEAAVDDIATAVGELGGFLALADLARDDGTGELYGTVTLRVPSEELLPALDALEELAVDAPVRRIEEQDVGGELTDLRAQVTNLTAYEEQLRELLTEVRENSSDPDDLLPVVERLQSVRSDIDRLRAQRDALEDRVALSTITVDLIPTAAEAPIVTTTWTPSRTLEEAVAATGRALAWLGDVAIWVVVTALPVLTILALPPAAVWLWWRRRRPTGRPGAPMPPTVSPPPPAA